MGATERLMSAIVLSLLAMTASSASGQERTEEACKRLYPNIVSPVEYASCTSDLPNSAKGLNSVYVELRGHMPVDYRALLDEAQKAWAVYRDAQCAYDAGGYVGNTANTSDRIACTASMNRERAAYLADELKRWTK